MSQPVTTNPLIIMLINMTVVFLVLIALGFLIQLIHIIDPTKKKAEPAAPVEKAAPAPAPAAVQEEPVFDGVSPETVAVIAAAIAAYGCGVNQIKAIRPIERNGWKNSGRTQLTTQQV